jgi:hypothetical protein
MTNAQLLAGVTGGVADRWVQHPVYASVCVLAGGQGGGSSALWLAGWLPTDFFGQFVRAIAVSRSDIGVA